MTKKVHKIGLFGSALLVVALSGSTVLASPGPGGGHAEAEGSSTSGTSTTSVSTNESETSTKTEDSTTSKSTEQPESHGSQGDNKLTTDHLRSCENRQDAINNILSRIVTRGTNQLNLFNSIAERVENFKTTKGLTVSNYDQLVAKLQADKTKATNDLATMKANDTLTCTSSDPKGMMSTFQSDLKTEINDLKTYKTDVKNLIVAVKTAAGSSTSTDNSTSTGGNQ